MLTVATTFAAANPTRTYDVYVYDSLVDGVSAYDRILLTRSGAMKNGSLAAANLAVGDWADVRLVGADGLIGSRAGQTAGFYVKLVGLAGGSGAVSSFKLYFTSVSRAIASCACDPNFESTLVDMFPTSTAADFAPLEAGIIDEDTYVEQGLKWADFHLPALRHILTVVQPNTDMLFLGTPVTDEFSHQFMGLVTPTDIDGDPNPYYDDLTNDNVPDGRVDEREGYIRAAYEEADETLGARTIADGPGCHRVRRVRPRLRAAVVRGQRSQGAHGRRHPDAGAAEQLPRGGHDEPGEGVLGRRHRADLREPDAPGRRDLRAGPDADRERVPEPERPRPTRGSRSWTGSC